MGSQSKRITERETQFEVETDAVSINLAEVVGAKY
jgi:hypothetical protein